MAGIALKGQCNLVSIMVPPGVLFKRKMREKRFREKKIKKVFIVNKVLTRPEVESMISMTNKYCYWLFLDF